MTKLNPFRPGFATTPPVLAGRDDLVAEMQTVTAVTHQAFGSHRVLYGPRGVGKTVLIDRFSRIGDDRRWGVVNVEVRSGGDLCASLLSRFHDVVGTSQKLRKVLDEQQREWGDRRQRVNLGVYSAEIRRTHHPGDELADQLRRVWTATALDLAKGRRGLMVLIDEAQNASADHLNMLGPILQDLSRSDCANVVVFAGLMSLPRHLVENVSYAERLLQTKLGHLDIAATAHAIAVPARDAGRRFDEDALQFVITATAGYPYFVQLYAYHAFESATGDRITLAAATAGAARAQRTLEDGMFRTRWSGLTPVERQFVHLMATAADDGGTARIADIASLANTVTQQWSMTRARLIDKGVIEPAGHGELQCPQPGFLDYAQRQPEARASHAANVS